MRVFLFIILLFSLTDLYSQISRGGKPMWPDSKKSKSVYQIPHEAVSRAIQQEFTDEDLIYGKKPFRVGVDYNLNISPETEGEWITLPDGLRLWRMEFYSEGALGLNLYFDTFKLNEEAVIFLYTPDGKNVLGGFNYLTNKKNGILPTAFLPGDRLVLELQVKAGYDYGVLNIGSISHAYVDIFGASQKDGYFGKSGDCEIDINCPTGYDWQVIKNAVCRIVFKKNGSFTELCTGSLINNTLQDESPYVYGANHCISRALEAGNAVFYFGLESEDCNGTDPFPSGAWNFTISSSELLATSDSLDFSLLKLSEKVPDSYYPYYAGWTIADTPPDNATTIHHPQGDVKKISRDYDNALIDYQEVNPPSWLSSGSIPSAFWRIEKWEEGATEGGSSGAPLFNSQKLIVGNLTGGDAYCGYPYNDYFSKFHLDWDYYSNPANQLKYWLDPVKSGVLSLEGMDPSDTKNIYEYLVQNPDYDKIIEYSEKAGYSEIFNNDGLYTFFVMADSSIEKLPDWYRNLLETGPDFFAREFIENFIVSGKYLYSDLSNIASLNSINGHLLNFSLNGFSLFINDSLILINDEISLSNGVLIPMDVILVSEENNYNNWEIYPNPNNGEFFVYSEESNLEDLTIRLYDRMGKMVGEQFFNDTQTTSFNFPHLPSGVYIAEIRLDNMVRHQKIVIVK
ncbi:MAG: T9SS type A sorting domain-containing protein [Bacteroidales bacterium]|nr:T9SS type A sorting domain-containing protein [Bacteroidales bacterium]MCF8389519.1 T9SS type A sorting domain-containing protein [Bacteroidales bacterium]